MRAPWKRKKPITAAAGEVHQGSTPIKADFIAKRREKWQDRALDLIEAVPEASGASALIENALNQVVLKIEGKGLPQEVIDDFNETLKGFDMGRAGMLIWQVGECYPLWRPDEDGEIEWEINSPHEIKAENGKPAKVMGTDGKMRELKADEKVYRCWKQDPKHRHLAWSPHKGLLDVLEAMYLHQLADTAVATSRLAGAGILYWPTDLPSLPLRDGNKPEEGSREELQQSLMLAMQQSIKDRASTDAFVPLVVFGDPSLGENFKPEHILLERPDNAKAWSERMEAYAKRYARGVELPIESVEGVGAANHWTAWVVKEDNWRLYMEPIIKIVTDGLLKNFVKPVLRELQVDESVRKAVTIVADGSKLIEKPDKSDSAIKLATIGGVINDAAIRRETGFTEADAGDGVREAQKARPPASAPDSRNTVPTGDDV